MATATTGVMALTPGDVERIRVLMIAITAPQQGQSIGGRCLRGGVKRLEAFFASLPLVEDLRPHLPLPFIDSDDL